MRSQSPSFFLLSLILSLSPYSHPQSLSLLPVTTMTLNLEHPQYVLATCLWVTEGYPLSLAPVLPEIGIDIRGLTVFPKRMCCHPNCQCP